MTMADPDLIYTVYDKHKTQNILLIIIYYLLIQSMNILSMWC